MTDSRRVTLGICLAVAWLDGFECRSGAPLSVDGASQESLAGLRPGGVCGERPGDHGGSPDGRREDGAGRPEPGGGKADGASPRFLSVAVAFERNSECSNLILIQ